MGKKESKAVRDDEHDVAIIIPTVGNDQLIGCVGAIDQYRGDKKVHLVISLNPLPETEEQAVVTKRICDFALESSDMKVTWEESPRALGFGGAVNTGFEALKKNGGVPPVCIILNDDTLPSVGWLDGLCRAFDAETCVHLTDPEEQSFPISSYGKVGIVGPVSSGVWRDQRINAEVPVHLLEQFSADYMKDNEDYYPTTEVISGFCMALKRDLIEELLKEDGFLFDPVYNKNIGGFEDDDICLRADQLGWRCLVAGDTYVHHFGSMTIGTMNIGKGLKNWPTHMKKWAGFTQRAQHLAATYRVKLETVNDLLMFKGSVQGCANLCDSISILLTAPIALHEAIDIQQLGPALMEDEVNLIKACKESVGREHQLGAMKDWVETVTAPAWHSKDCGKVKVDKWEGFFNERDERNAAIELTYEFEPDWIISFDHDEILEQRVDRAKMERLMKCPDPSVMAYDYAWMNHWNSPNHIRRLLLKAF